MTRVRQPGALLRTVRHLRARQVLHQLRHRALGRARRPAAALRAGLTGVAAGAVPAPASPEGTLDAAGRVVLLHAPGFDPLRDGWEPPDADPLWCYTLHYHGWIGAAACRAERARDTVLHWIAHHRAGTGWSPYPTSMRVLHWIGWLSAGGSSLDAAERERVLASLAAQAHHLARHLEIHLDGNHLWTNLAALALAGLALEGDLAERLRARFVGRFADTVEEQLAPDGSHLERTPSYHCLLAEQLDLVASAARARGDPRAGRLERALRRMLGVLPAFTHPDGDVALFGDSQLGAPVTPERLARRTGTGLAAGDADAPDGAMARRAFGPWTVLWNAGGCGMRHQVGHLHADALSVELSLGRERVLVDAGTGGYRPGPERAYARSTAAHNTVTVGAGDPDQHELWASHRIGARAETTGVQLERARLAGTVRGWRSPAAHEREILAHGACVRVRDRVHGAVPATVRYFLPASCALEPQGGGWLVRTPQGVAFEITAGGDRLARSDAPGWTAIGRPAPRICLSAPVPPRGITVELAPRGRPET